jgi:soluble lytic murein transglycosylase-like protein
VKAEDRYDSLIRYYGEQFGVDWVLLKAQVHAESGFDPEARSIVGAVGLAQFMSATWAEWADGTPGTQDLPPHGLYDRRNPEMILRAQAAMMAWLLRQLGGSVDQALAAYNFGIGNVKRGKPWPKETRDYVQRINRFRSELMGA